MSTGFGLLKTVVTENRPIGSLLDAGITDDMWHETEYAVFEFIRSYQADHGALPKLATIKAEVGISLGTFPDEPFGYWVGALKRRARIKVLKDSTSEVNRLLADGQLDEATDVIRSVAVHLDKLSGRTVHYLDDVAQEILREHHTRQMAASLSGVSFGLPSLDRVTDGAQSADVISIVGETSVGKSFLLLRMALSAYLAGEVPLFISMEMTPKQCYRRIIALYSGISATAIRVGRLSYWGEGRLRQAIRRIERDSGGRKFRIIDGALTASMEDVAIRVQEIMPTVLYLDGAYLIKTKSGGFRSKWEQVSLAAEETKLLAKKFKIPVVATYQFNRKGAGNIDHIGLSASIGQLSSIVIGLNQCFEADSPGGARTPIRNRRIIELLKGREGEWGKLLIHYDVSQRMLIDEVEVMDGFELIG